MKSKHFEDNYSILPDDFSFKKLLGWSEYQGLCVDSSNETNNANFFGGL